MECLRHSQDKNSILWRLAKFFAQKVNYFENHFFSIFFQIFGFFLKISIFTNFQIGPQKRVLVVWNLFQTYSTHLRPIEPIARKKIFFSIFSLLCGDFNCTIFSQHQKHYIFLLVENGTVKIPAEKTKNGKNIFFLAIGSIGLRCVE